MKRFVLPDLGEGLTESELVSWRVSPGDRVELNQVIAEVETAKALVELPSPTAGIVVRLHAEPGDTVAVGGALIDFETGADAEIGTEAETRTEPGAANAPAAGREPVLVGYGPRQETGDRPKRRERPGLVPDAAPRGAATGADPAPAGNGAAAAPVDVRRPIEGVRRRTAQAMAASAAAPHVTEFLTIDVTPTMSLIDTLRGSADADGHRVNILTVVAKAVCIAAKRNPSLNSRWDGEAGEIVEFASVALGIAAATPRGLLVPNIAGADRLTLFELADAIAQLTATARQGRTAPSELRGGTITITNVGVFGVDAGTPMLNPGEAAILAMGAVRTRPWAFEGGIALRRVMTLCLSFDHRLVDGEQGSRFLVDVGSILADPAMVLTMV